MEYLWNIYGILILFLSHKWIILMGSDGDIFRGIYRIIGDMGTIVTAPPKGGEKCFFGCEKDAVSSIVSRFQGEHSPENRMKR